ncbi:MAG: flagellar assembly protein FliW, partial [Mycetocola sp.]
DASVLVVINPGEDEATTVNLLAPIVLNRATGGCAQLILEGQDWPLRAQLASVAGQEPVGGR